MGRYYYSKKDEADSLKKIQTWFLKKHGYFNIGCESGNITWANSWTENKNSISIYSNVFQDESYIRLTYTQTDRDTREEKHFDCKITLTTTPCFFGGKRYWFICSVYKSGVYCGRRVGVLYKGGDYFACRHCYNLTYNSRNLGGISKTAGQVISIPDLERMVAEVKRRYYAGRKTRKYKRYLKKERKSTLQMLMIDRMLEYGLNKKF